MGEEEEKKKNLAAALAKDVAEEKAVNPPPAEEKKHDDSKSLAIVEKVADPSAEKILDRDAILTRVETEKRICLIRAWEDSVKTKAENKSIKKMCAITSWENTQKASIEAQLKKIEEDLEKKKAEYAEKMKNKVAMVHKLAEERRALTQAKRGEEVLKAEEIAAKYRASGVSPIKLFGCFGA